MKKIIISLLLYTLLGAWNTTVQAKEYDLWIFGKQVTDDNRKDIKKDGSCSYDPILNQLTISKKMSGGTSPFIINSIDGLEVYVAEDAKITCRGNMMELNRNTTITGPGKLTLTTNITAQYGINCFGSILTIKNANLALSVPSQNAIIGSTSEKGQLIIDRSNLEVSGKISGFMGGITLTNCEVVEPAGVRYDSSTGSLVDLSGNETTSFITKANEIYYDLYVGCKQVLATNMEDILGKDECSYDPETKTLTLKKSIVEKNCVSIENVGIDGLIVKTDSAVGLFGHGIISQKNIILTGSGSLSVYPYFDAIEILDGATLTIKDLTMDLHGNEGKGIYGKGNEKLVVEGTAKITIESTEGAVCGFGQGIELKDRAIQSPAGATVKDGTIVKSDGTVATEVTIGAPIVNLRVAGVGVTSSNQNDILGDGAASYDPTTNTLTLKGSIHGNDKQGIWSNLADLTIQVAKNDLMVTSTGSAAMVLRGNTTSQGPGFLSVKSTSSNGILVSQGATLTVENITLDVLGGGQYGNAICGGDYSSKEKLIVRNAAVFASSSSLGAIDSFHGGITLEGCSIMEPAGGQIKTNTSGVPYRIVDKNGNMAKTVKIGRAYNLWISGKRVTDDNRFDVLGDGVFQYDPDENVLHLKKSYADIPTYGEEIVSMSSPTRDPIVESNIEGLTISVDADIEITAYSEVFHLKHNTTITGPGKLTLSMKTWHYILIDPMRGSRTPHFDAFTGISFMGAKDTLTIANANITITSDNGESVGITGNLNNSATSLLIVKDSYLHVEGGVSKFNGGITLDGCKIIEPKEGRIQDGTIVDANGNAVWTVTIGNPADVNRDGTVDSADIVAVIKEMPDGDKKADVNNDGVIDSADIVAVIKAMK